MNYKNISLKIWALIAIVILIGSIGAIWAYDTYVGTHITTDGTIETTVPLLIATPSTIDWGTITIYGSTTKIISLKNNSTNVFDKIIDMTFQTANWQNTTDLGLTLNWNYTGTDILPQTYWPIMFTLTSIAPPENTTATTFSFDIIVTPTIDGNPP